LQNSSKYAIIKKRRGGICYGYIDIGRTGTGNNPEKIS